MATSRKKTNGGKKVTRYTHDNVKEPRTPETGHTSLLPDDEQVVTLPMDNGWSKAISIGKLPEGDDRPVVVDMDPAVDPVLFWSGKRNRREVPVLPLQRNEIVSESRIAQIIGRVRKAAENEVGTTGHLFADLEKTLRESDRSKRVEFYTHDEGWKNKLICGDSLHVMESLLHYEGMRSKVQMIYIDPPYGIRYGANFQQRIDTTVNDEEDRSDEVLAIKAFRDTWSLGPHSYLSYLQDRLYLCRELLTKSGSIFVQINDENLHRVRAVLDEVFGHNNFVSQIMFATTSGFETRTIASVGDFLLWYANDIGQLKSHKLFTRQELVPGEGNASWVLLSDGSYRGVTAREASGVDPIPEGAQFYFPGDLQSQGPSSQPQPFSFEGKTYLPGANSHWKANYPTGMQRLADSGRIHVAKNSLRYRRFHNDFPYQSIGNMWTDTQSGNFTDPKVYVVQTNLKVVERCLFLSTDPGDLVFDPTCGRGTTAIAAENLGRRWITCDTSRVAINVTRKELLRRTFDHFITKNGRVGQGLEYEKVAKVTLGSIANDLEPELVEFVNRPIPDSGAVRVTGPFEVLAVGRYSADDWKGSVIREAGLEPAKLENYIEVICRLYRKGAAVQGASGLVHAIVEEEKRRVAISVGPLTGRVTAKQIHDAVQDAMASGILEVHVLGWAFEANVGEVKSQLEKRGRVKIELIMIRPDTLAEGLKVTKPEMLFSPLALPDIDVKKSNGDVVVRLNGVALFDRKRRASEYKTADSGYVSAWYLDEDYDGDCFVDCQMFFDFKKTPNLKAALRVEIDPDEFKLKLHSEPFKPRQYKRIAVKVVDVYGNESTVVRELG